MRINKGRTVWQMEEEGQRHTEQGGGSGENK